ncbi:MAG: DsbA family protein, partial [Pseudomonadota bacterium]
RKYTQSWLKVASDKPGADFKPWSTEEAPPSHSIPPHLVAKAAAQLDETVFESIHEALMSAYFEDNRDISSEETLKSIWRDVGLDEDQFSISQEPKFLKSVIDEHNEALACGAQGAPSFRMSHHDVAITGLHTVEVLERWINRVLDDKV